jgi:hypothetical protein
MTPCNSPLDGDTAAGGLFPLRSDRYCVVCSGACADSIQTALVFLPWKPMTQDERDTVKMVYREYAAAKEALAALETSLTEIAATSSITTDEGYLMYSPSGLRLHATDFVSEQVARYHTAKQYKEVLRKRLIELGEPDPSSNSGVC